MKALNLFTTALGSWLMIPLVFLVNSGLFGSAWITENLDDGHLADYFFLLTGIMFVNQVGIFVFQFSIPYFLLHFQLVFYWVSSGYEYKTDAELKVLEEEDNEENFTITTSVANPI